MAIGCYVPKYYPSSYKGVEFEALESTSEHGRRGAEGEFPFGEETGYADTGRRIRKFTVNGRFPTNDHLERAGALIAAVETPGPGILVHAARGSVMVACTSLKVKDDPIEEAGVTTFTAEFVEANDWVGFGLRTDLIGLAFDVFAVAAAVADAFAFEYRPDDVPFYRFGDAVGPAGDAARLFADQIRRSIDSMKTDHDNAWWAIAELEAFAVDEGALRLAETVRSTLTLASVALAAYQSGYAKFVTMKRVANEFARDSRFGGRVGAAQNAVFSFVRVISATHMVNAALEEPPATLSAAMDQIDQISAILADEIAVARATCNNAAHLYLREMLVKVRRSLFATSYSLPAIVTYEFPSATHSRIAAYEIFGDAARAREIEARNPSGHPWSVGPSVVSGRA